MRWRPTGRSRSRSLCPPRPRAYPATTTQDATDAPRLAALGPISRGTLREERTEGDLTEIENEFTVPTAVEPLWAYLLDVERVAPCMPGAELTETVDDHTWKGKVNMKLGPVSLSFAGTVTMQERDDAAKRVVLVAKGMEAKGKGAANASITSWLEPAENGTLVKMKADIHLTGTVAQMSRGLLPEVSRRLTQQFADCLQASMGAIEHEAAATEASTQAPASAAAPAPVAKPIGGIRLGLSAIWASIAAFFRKLFGKRKPPG